MDQRLQFVTDALRARFTMTELCARYGVSRRIGYKWLARFAEDGKRGLVNRSRRPHTCPTQIRPVLAELLCEFRRLHPDWARASCSRCCAADTRRLRTGRQRARPRISSRGMGSSAIAGVGASGSIPGWSRS